MAITAALELEADHPLFKEAKTLVERARVGGRPDKVARASIGGVAAATWCRWKRRCGLEVKVTNPGGQHATYEEPTYGGELYIPTED